MSSTSNTNDSEGDRKSSPKIDDEKATATAKPATSSSRGRRRRLKFEETINPDAERIQFANDMDIIFGRGRGFQDHPGNKRMRSIVSRHKEEYRALELSKKRALVEAVYDEIIESGARFLHKQGEGVDTFVIVEVPVALQKVRNLLRCKKVFGKKKPEQSEKIKISDSTKGVEQVNVVTGALSEGGKPSAAIQPPLVGALSEMGNQSSPIQPPSVAQIANVSAPSPPIHLSPAPLLAMEQLRQRASLVAPHQGMLDSTAGLQPNSWTGSLPNPFAMQRAPIEASTNSVEQLQMFQQYQQQLRAAELANLIQSNKKTGER